MKHNCPHCGAARELNAHDIPQQGVKLQCFNCFGTFSVSAETPSVTSSITPPSPVADDLFETRGGFGFDLGADIPQSRPMKQVASTPPPLPPSTSKASPTFQLGGEDLPEPVTTRRAPLKVFSATPPPLMNTPVEESPELFAVQSRAPESPELFAVQSRAPESPELFAVQSRAPESPELFAVQSRAPESPELFATQSRAPESPELFATQSRAPEPSELFATQSRAPEPSELFATQSRAPEPSELFATQSFNGQSTELNAQGTVGALEFGGLNDLFDQGEAEIETLFDTSDQSKHALLSAQQSTNFGEDTLIQAPGAQASVFSDQAVFSSGGMFDFGADRGFDFDQTSRGGFGFGAEEPQQAVALETPIENAPPTLISPPSELPIDVPPIMFDMGAEVKPPLKESNASVDELMSIDIEEDDESLELEEDAEEHHEEEESTTSQDEKNKKSNKGAGLILVALIAILLGYLITQKPEMISDLIGPEFSENLGITPVSNQGSINRSTNVSSQSSSNPITRPVSQQIGNTSQETSQQQELGSSNSTSASLRAISQAARGDRQNSASQKRSSSSTNPNNQSLQTKTQPSQVDLADTGSSWFSPLAAISAAFKGDAKVKSYQQQLDTPSKLDTEGFNTASQPLKTAQGLELVRQAEEVGLGVLHFDVPGMVWRREILNQAQALSPEQAQSPEGERTLVATQLIYDVEGAMERAIAIGHAQSNHAAAQELMGYAYLKRGQSYEAQRAFERAYTLDPERTRAQQKFATLASRNGDLSAADKALMGLIKKQKGAPSVQQMLADVKLSQGDQDEAFSWIHNLMNTSPDRLSPKERAQTLSTLVRALDQKIEATRDSTRGSDEDEAQILSLEKTQRAALTEIVQINPDDQQSLNRLLKRDEQAGRWKSALKQVQQLRETSGDSASLMLKELQILKKLGRNEKAKSLLDQMLDRYNDKPLVHLAEGDFYIDKRDYTKARSALMQARRIAPNDPEPILALTQLLVKDSRAGEAQEFLEQQSAERPWSAKLHNGLGNLKLKIAQTSGQRQMFKEAEEAYNRALTIDPGLSEARVQRARAQLQLEKPQQALADLKWLRDQGYQNSLDFEFGQAQQSLGNGQEAQRYFKRVLDQNREHIEALRAMGSLKQAERKMAEAKQYYEDALAVNSRDPLTRYELGRIALQDQDASKAVEHLRIATEAKEQDPQLQYWYGRALEKEGDPNSTNNVREAYEKSVTLLPKDAKETPPELCDAHYRVGLVHANSKNSKELKTALEDFSRASQCSPHRADVWTRLAESYEKFGNRDEMMVHYKRALKEDRNYIPALLGSARSLLNEIPPQVKEAKQHLNLVLKRDKNNPEAHFQLCKLTQSTSRRKARNYCKRYLKLDPKGRFAPLAKEIIQSL